MSRTILSSDEPVLLVGAGAVELDDFTTLSERVSHVVAADGGAQAVLAAGQVPDLVIGDMDSALSDPRLEGRIYQIDEQDSTDFDKALRSISTPLVLALGLTGKRLDHELATLTVLVRYPDRPCIVLGEETLVFLCPPRLTLDLPLGSIFSLFPMGRVRVESEGLRWPTGGIEFAPDGRIGTSNEVSGPIALVPDAPRMLVLLPREPLDHVIERLYRTEGWP
ncbi:thiamine diphosphokinase [Aestuariibius insulae]|uniref:thiamine diphosphokinase n=1 Tax=Aestuariibius insulae TaxID=2058287 RepID=UPI00345E7EBB